MAELLCDLQQDLGLGRKCASFGNNDVRLFSQAQMMSIWIGLADFPVHQPQNEIVFRDVSVV